MGMGMGIEINEISLSTAVVLTDIAAERWRQLTGEGFTAERDDDYIRGELAQAGACYAHPRPPMVLGTCEQTHEAASVPVEWPWHLRWWKPTTRRRDLVKAAALIIAEIERLDREESNRGTS